MNLIEQHKSEIIELCKSHYIRNMYAFGSVVRSDFNENSDVDFLITFQDLSTWDWEKIYVENFFNLKETLENKLKRTVDLVVEESLRNPILIRNIQKDKMLVYEC